MKFYMEKDLGVCGLACVLCSHEDCPGCKVRCTNGGNDCTVCECAVKKGLGGCYQCDVFPCDEGMLQGIRNRAFNQYAKKFGRQELLDRLRVNFENGITYHRADGLKGDYDLLSSEDEITRLVRYGASDPYIKCPVFETESFMLRLVSENDARGLLSCYSDLESQQIFNSDTCTSDFTYDSIDEIQKCIRMWLDSYEQQEFVRFTIIDKAAGCAVGAIEMFGMVGAYKTSRGILRLDIASEYENPECLYELFALCIKEFFILFGVEQIVTKAIPFAKKRLEVLERLGFKSYMFPEREHYWEIRHKDK